MRRPHSCVLCVVLGLITVDAQEPPPTFRSEARLVTVNASIERGRRPVPGLTATDFVLLDNGVEQSVTEVAYETVPVDVTVILDVSNSTSGNRAAIERDGKRIAAFLRPNERLRMLAIDTYVQELAPLAPAKALTVLPLSTTSGYSAVHDAVAAALLVAPDPGRRQLVVALTDAQENASAISARQLVTIARASDSVLMIVHPGPPRVGTPQMGAKLPYLTATVDPGGGSIAEAARVTGGELFNQSIFGNSPISAVERLIELFRQSYVLRYSPTGVEPGGWHDIDLRVKGQRGATVRARRGYFGG